jgi:hypothetical protein
MHLNDDETECVNFLTGYSSLLDMGFEAENIKEALVVSGNSLTAAIEYLSKGA